MVGNRLGPMSLHQYDQVSEKHNEVSNVIPVMVFNRIPYVQNALMLYKS